MASKEAPLVMVSKEVLCNDLRVALHGKVDADTLEASVQSMQRASSEYSATGSVVSAIFYVRLQVNVKGSDPKTFQGDAGGIFTPGGGAIVGTLFTDDVNKLYANTVSFQFNSTPVYFNVNFFDGNSNLLGHVQAGGLSVVTGIGGGTGSWS